MSSIARLQRENEELRRQLGEAEDALRAIREGQVDAIVVDGERGTQVFSLAGAERIYRVLVETMYEAALTVAPDGTILFCNQRFCDLMRTALPETVGRKLEAFTPAEERPELAALLAAARTGPAHRQFVLRADDGTVVPAQLAANLLDDGESPSVCVVASDLTELEASARSIRVLMEHQRAMEEAQAALRSSEERYRRLVETASEGIWLVDAGLRTIDVNNRMAEMLGRARDELFGRQVSEFLPPEEAPQSAKRMADRLRGHSETFELPLRRKDGSTCWTLVSASPLRDGQDRIVGSFGMFTDITERRRAEEVARRGEEERKVAEVVRGERQRLFGVLETLPAMICLLTPDHHVAFANRSFRDRFGDARGRRCFEANFNRDAPCEFCETYNVLATGQPHRLEAAVPGETVLDVFALPFTDADGSPMILEMNLDITERRRAEQQLQNAHENLAARVSQLRALAGELTLSEQRERWRLAKVLHDHLQQLLVAAKFRTAIVGRLGDDLTRQATAEIEHLLDESISSARELTSELSPPVLHQAGLPAGLEWLARWMADRHALHVNLAIEGGLPPLAEDVRILLFESVRELLFNVVKHANVASADVSVGRVAGDDIRIAVSDSGAGFDPGTLKQAGEVGSGFGLFSIR